MVEPLHPLVVHFPIALCLVVPLIAVSAVVAIWRGTRPRCAYGAVLAAQLLLAGSAYFAQRTGGGEEEHVAEVVAHDLVEEHEEAAELFVYGTYVAVLFAALGMVSSPFGKILRIAHLLVCVGLCWLCYEAGSSGGELVYKHGAAEAYYK